ncbi:UNVERIFIED_CONTAM: hypothetical protein Sindi_2239900 [Sesamum indicum]
MAENPDKNVAGPFETQANRLGENLPGHEISQFRAQELRDDRVSPPRHEEMNVEALTQANLPSTPLPPQRARKELFPEAGARDSVERGPEHFQTADSKDVASHQAARGPA